MVRLDDRLEKIKRLYVDRRKYFVINRGRQYGKTTTLKVLAEYLKNDYAVLSMDFQMMSTADFADEQTFTLSFVKYLENLFSSDELMKVIDTETVKTLHFLSTQEKISMNEMFFCLSEICKASKKAIILMIDEVDSASNNQVFIDFLALLRGYYLDRERRPIFHSVILAGVYDIKNLKLKIRPDKEHQYNSQWYRLIPWNIAADFDIDMSFSVKQIIAMLEEYEADHHTGMDTAAVAGEIYQYTSGYPYLVSAICKIMDEKLPYKDTFSESSSIWTKEGIGEAVKILLRSRTTLFDSMVKHIYEYPDLREMLNAILFQGEQVAYNQYNHTIELACMFGYIVDDGVNVQVANRIFETCLYNLFLSEEELRSIMSKKAKQNISQFVSEGRLDMKQVLRKFVEYFNEIYGDNNEEFIEAFGRKFFLLYLKPVINGTGNYYIEAQTRNAKRTDIVVDYLGEQFIIGLKIWHGNEYHERGERQLVEYLDYFHQKKGYLLSFNFNKKKEIGVKELQIEGKIIIEAVV